MSGPRMTEEALSASFWACDCGQYWSLCIDRCFRCGKAHSDAHPAAIERKPVATHEPAPRRANVAQAMNKTEARYAAYLDTMMACGNIRKWDRPGIVVYIAGHPYTPDFRVTRNDGSKEIVEVKGSYKLHSHGRSRLAFDAARDENPEYAWTWATREGDGWRYEYWERRKA